MRQRKSVIALARFNLDTYGRVIRREQLTQQAFANAVTRTGYDSEGMKHKAWHYLRNAAGTLLNQISHPDDDAFIARLWDLNCKIALFNAVEAKGKLPLDPSAIADPYYAHGKGAHYSPDGQEICLDGPLKDAGNLRCLRVKTLIGGHSPINRHQMSTRGKPGHSSTANRTPTPQHI